MHSYFLLVSAARRKKPKRIQKNCLTCKNKFLVYLSQIVPFKSCAWIIILETLFCNVDFQSCFRTNTVSCTIAVVKWGTDRVRFFLVLQPHYVEGSSAVQCLFSKQLFGQNVRMIWTSDLCLSDAALLQLKDLRNLDKLS